MKQDDNTAIESRRVEGELTHDGVTSAIVETVTVVAGSGAGILDEPLYNTVDVEAMAALLGHADGDAPQSFHFEIADCDVVVSSDGCVVTRAKAADGPSTPDLGTLVEELRAR